jgi:predicted nucleic acid-binding protein
MRCVDTSAWIEVMIGTPAGRTVLDLLPEPEDWLVPTIIQMELVKWARRQPDGMLADNLFGFSKRCVVVPLDEELAFAAADVSRTHRLPTADAIVYATAQAMDAGLITCDAHFRDLPGVTLVGKDAT